MELLLTECPEKKQGLRLRSEKTGSKQIPGGKGTGGPMPRKGEDARPGPMVRGAAVLRGDKPENFVENFQE